MKTSGMMLQEHIESQTLNEMANVSKRTTGLPMCIWVLSEIPVEHNLPRLKFQNNYSDKVQPKEMIPVSISDNPVLLIKNLKLKISSRDFELLRKWIIKNKELLLRYWNYDATIEDLIDGLKK